MDLHGMCSLGKYKKNKSSRVVNDHIIGFDACRFVTLGNTTESVQEETVAELHDVSLVYTGHFLKMIVNKAPVSDVRRTNLAVILEGEVESKTGYTFCFCPCGDLQTLHDTGITLVLQARVLTLGVFTNDSKIDIGVACWESRERLAHDNRSVDVKLLTHGDVP